MVHIHPYVHWSISQHLCHTASTSTLPTTVQSRHPHPSALPVLAVMPPASGADIQSHVPYLPLHAAGVLHARPYQHHTAAPAVCPT